MSIHRKSLQILSIILILSILFSGFTLPAASAQGNDGIQRQLNAQTGKVSFLGPQSGGVISAAKALGISAFARPAEPGMALAKRFGPEFGLKDAARDLTELKTNRSEKGRMSVRYQQNYQGIPVMGGELIVNTNENGDLYSMNGEVSVDLSLSTHPKIDAEQARQTALQSTAKWHEKSLEDFTSTEPELWIFDESLLRPSTRPAELVWRMEVTPNDSSLPVRELVLVNAERGHISLHFNQIDTVWSLSEKTVTVQDIDPTSTPQPAETPPPTETPELAGTPTPQEEMELKEGISSVDSPRGEVTSLSGLTWYVASTGNNSNSCSTPALPCLTIDGALAKASTDDLIKVASGMYTASGTEVLLINKVITLSGGWDNTFSTQNGTSVIDGQGARRGVINTATNVVMDRFTIQGGFHTIQGGGIYNQNGRLTLNNSAVSNNLSQWMGGGIYNNSTAILTINNSTINGNSAGKSTSAGGGGGGGISNNGTITFNNGIISNNVIIGGYSGSGIYNSGNFTLNGSTVSGSIGSVAIEVSGGSITSMTLNNSTVSGNAIGAIHKNHGNLVINNSTISGNGTGIGAQSGYLGSVTLKNSIIAGNTSDCWGPIVSGGNNLISNTYGCTFTPSTGDLTNIAPGLSAYPIGSPAYYVLLANSPAVNAGDPSTCLTTDQRGMLRPQGTACDIGAYEYAAPGPAASVGVVSGSNQRAGASLPFSLPLVAYVIDSSGSPVSGVNVSFTAPASGASGIFAASGTRTITVSTNAEGVAVSSILTANSQLGTYNVTVTVAGLSGAASFVLTNANWFVSPTGNDGNSCSAPTSACQTMNGAIGKALNGDVIKVAVGTFTGGASAVVNTTKDLTLSGGWNNTFTSQNGFSVIDGQNIRGGIHNTSAKTAIDHFIVQNGYTANSGGGIYNYLGSFTVNKSLIINNQAGNGGGGIFSSGDLIINDSTVRNNSSSHTGGGIAIYLLRNSLTLNNSTIAANLSNSYGGGIALDYSSGGSTPGVITIQNSTIVNNSAMAGGGIYNGGGSTRTLNIKNSIIANNTGNSGGPDCQGTINLFDHSLLGNISNCSLSAGPDSHLNTIPLVSPYPVGTLGYHALQSASPAINTGANCLSVDQRGVARPQGNACDMGAYELTSSGVAASFGIADGSNQRAGSLYQFSKSLVTYVVDSVGSPVSGASVTFTAPISGASGTFATSGNNTATALTNSDGVAISPTFTANSQLGSYNVTATVAGLSGSASFVLTNTEWFVSPTGSDSNSCSSPSTPCVTINGAIGKALKGDVIKVAAGTYTGTSTIVNITKDLILSGGWNNTFTSQTGFSVIDGGNQNYYGVTTSASNVSISRFIIQNNQYGIYHSGGTLNFDQGALIGNNNGIYNYDGNTNFINTSISGNHAGGTAGSAISNVRGTTRILFSTITNNTGGSYAIYSANGYAYIKIGNSILAGNDNDCYIGSNPNFSEGYNIFGKSPACSGSYVLQTTDKVGVDPKLFSLLSRGYHPVLPGSPAIDAANTATCPATDQRGVGRPIGSTCDIGAVEYRATGTAPAFVIAYAGTPQSIMPGGSAATRLKALVLDENGDSVPGKTVTFTAPANGASIVFSNTQTYISTAVTDATGIATSAGFSANNIHGSYVVVATVTGSSNATNFQLSNGVEKIRTYTANNGISLPGTFLCDQTQLNCTNNSNPHADAAHKYAIGIHHLYMDQHQRQSIDNNNMQIISTVHFASGYANAFWDGNQMVYGDAYGFPLADDVVAHELTHGVTQYESNLFYYYQSGAINESFSDLWGEYYDQTNGLGNDSANNKWMMGEDVSGMGALRSMSNPTLFGDPDRMTSINYYTGQGDNGGVHTNSGINNKAVYLMVDGGTFNDRTVTALGWVKTAAIYYEANTNLLTSGADYSDLYYTLQQACSNLIGQKGITSADCTEVKDAIDAVQMNAQPVSNFNTDAPYCNADIPMTTVLSEDFEAGTAHWSFKNGAYTRWQWDSPYGPYAHSGAHFLYADDSPGTVTDASAQLAAFTVPSKAFLHFAHAYEFETLFDEYYDGGVLEYSINNGTTWLDAGHLIDFNGYQGTIYTGYGNPLAGRSGFVDTSHGYISTRLNLASLAGKTVTFRWRMGLDEGIAFWGWWVDDIRLYRCIPDPVGLGKYDDAHAGWTYSGAFSTFASSGAYQGGIHYSTTIGNAAEFSFDGSQISLLYTANSNRGKVDVFVDEVKIGTIDQYSASVVYQKKWTSGDLGSGTHTVRFVHAGPAGTLINIDAIEVGTYQPPVPVGTGTYDDDHVNWMYSGSFTSFASASAYQGGIRYTTTVGNSAEFTFSGSQISLLYTGNTNRGKVDVYVDEVKIGTIDQYTSTAAFQKKWTSGDLGVGTHTVKFVHAGPVNTMINIDAIEVGTYQPPVPVGTGTYDDEHVNWTYSGSFTSFASASAYQGGIRYTTTVGNFAEFTFEGSQISLLYTGNTNRGKVDVYVDEVKIGTIDQYTSTAVFQKKWTSGDLGAGTHTVKFVNAGPSETMINIDAIEVGTYQSPVTPGAGTYDDSHAGWTYSGTFTVFASANAYEGGIRYTTTLGNSAEFTFNGSQISLLYTANSNRGKVDVFVDEVKIGTIDQYTFTAVFQKKWTSGDLGAGTHTVRFVHAGPSGTMINIDAIEVGTYQPLGAGTYDDSHAGWTYSGSFTVFASPDAYQGGIRYTTTMGDYAEFTFSGSQISLLYTGNSNRGKVDMYVDGIKVATIDQYTPTAEFQKMWASGDLGAGTHTVKFVHAGPSGITVNIDAIQIQ